MRRETVPLPQLGFLLRLSLGDVVAQHPGAETDRLPAVAQPLDRERLRQPPGTGHRVDPGTGSGGEPEPALHAALSSCDGGALPGPPLPDRLALLGLALLAGALDLAAHLEPDPVAVRRRQPAPHAVGEARRPSPPTRAAPGPRTAGAPAVGTGSLSGSTPSRVITNSSSALVEEGAAPVTRSVRRPAPSSRDGGWRPRRPRTRLHARRPAAASSMPQGAARCSLAAAASATASAPRSGEHEARQQEDGHGHGERPYPASPRMIRRIRSHRCLTWASAPSSVGR